MKEACGSQLELIYHNAGRKFGEEICGFVRHPFQFYRGLPYVGG